MGYPAETVIEDDTEVFQLLGGLYCLAAKFQLRRLGPAFEREVDETTLAGAEAQLVVSAPLLDLGESPCPFLFDGVAPLRPHDYQEIVRVCLELHSFFHL